VFRVLDTGCSDFANDYYLTISATGPYQVTAKVGKEILDLPLNEATDVLIPVTETVVYKLEITSEDIPAADSRLIIEFSGIVGPSFVASISSEGRASDSPSCSVDQDISRSFESSYFVLEVPTCVFSDGTYYITLTQRPDTTTTCANVTVVVTAVVVPYELEVTSVDINTVLTGETVSLITRDVTAETSFKFYRIKSALNADEAFGQARLLNVQGGSATLFVTESSFSLPAEASFPGSRFGTNRNFPISGVLPHTSIPSDLYQFDTNFPTVDFIGLDTDGDLVFFNSADPTSFFYEFISLPGGEILVGIDFRPLDGILYGMSDANRLYKIQPDSDGKYSATLIGSGASFSTPLSGDAFGFDFNPAADRIRVTSNTNQNLRLNQLTGTLAAVDTTITPLTTNPVAAAYTNSVVGPTSTTLYIIDSVTDSLYLQGGLNSNPSPNGGVLTLVGPLGVDTSDIAGFDILPEAKVGFATLLMEGSFDSGLYFIDLQTGRATYVGLVDAISPITGLAIVPTTAPTDADIPPSGCADLSCTSADGSCAITITPCTWGSASYYLAVAATSQDAADVPITYDLVLNEYSEYTEITPNSNKVDSFDGNFANHYYAGITDGQQSIRFRTEVINGEGVLVTVRNHQCPDKATWIREVYCSGRYFDSKFQCDIDVSTRAQHPGSLTTTFFATVTGSNATYSISFFAGRQNCHDFSGTGAREGLNFCQSLVPYSTYRWEDYSKRDSAAQCLFNELYDHFRVQPCWSGVTHECNATLQRFACYENFHRCDEDGFAVGTCRKACEAVVYECVNWFESVDLEHYNCTSPRYLDSNHACTGHLENDAYDTVPDLIDDPLVIIYENDLARGAASSLSTSFVLVFLALVVALFF